MPCPESSMYIIIGEMNNVVTAMRGRSNRWSSHIHEEEEQDSLLRGFNSLKDVINQLQNFSDLEPITYLSPFLEVIRSENTSGLVTGLGLSAIYKFLSFGLVDAKSPSAAVASENIASAVTHARFTMIDAASDEIVLMKIIQVLRILLLSPLGALLTNESVCEIIQSFFRMCFETRFSEILRKTAESAVVDTVQLLFCCLPQFTEDPRGTHTSMKKLKMHSNGLDKGCYGQKKHSVHGNVTHKKINHLPRANFIACQIVTSPNSQNSDVSKNDVHLSLLDDTSKRERKKPENIFMETSEGIPNSDLNGYASSAECDKAELNAVNCQREAMSDLSDTSGHIVSEVDEKVRKDDHRHEEKHYALENELKEVGDSIHVSDTGSDSTFVSVQDTFSSVVDDANTYHDENDYVNPRGIRFTPHQPPKEGSGPLMPYGLPCVRELFRLLSSLINPLDGHNTDVTIQIGLNLITVALETGADNLGRFSSLLCLIRDEMCRNLFSLLSSERLTIFSTTLRVFFLLFEALRTHLKFQLEKFLINLMDIITSESSKVSYEQREISLDYLIHLWRIPSFVTELYINYDCDLYCFNLFEHLTKLLAKNAFPISGLYSVHLLSLDALLAVIDNIEKHCHFRMRSKTELCAEFHFSSMDVDIKAEPDALKASVVQEGVSGYHFGQQLLTNNAINKDNLLRELEKNVNGNHLPSIRPNRMVMLDDRSLNFPSHEELMAIKHKKKILASGTEQFNSQPTKGITFLQEHGLLKKPLDPEEVALFLRDNPRLDKKMIGQYISNRKNLKVLEAFVKSFTFEETRIDEALRQYLETFRLPGEAPLISLIMEHFAEHWHNSNKQPFANSDAAFTLAYAIIMLNVDQHNHNVKKQNNPMTLEDFTKNLKNVNGNKDFDKNMLEKIYISIKNEEIVMPAEQTGLVRENYLWKVLLRRGGSKEGKFTHIPNGVFDHDLFLLVWGPTVTALSYIFDKSEDMNVIEKTVSGFQKCAMIAAHYGMCDVFDNLVISLCKFTLLVNSTENPKLLPIVFGNNSKAQLATKAVFRLAHCHGEILKEGWKNLIDLCSHLFKAKLLPQKLVEVEDFLSPNGVISLVNEDLPSNNIPRAESGLFSSFYSYLTSDSPSQRFPSQEDENAKKAAADCIKECHCEQLFDETKFLRIDSLQELVKTLIFVCPSPEPNASNSTSFDEDAAVFILELLIKIILLNRDRVMSIWPGIQDHMFSIIMNAALSDKSFLLERAVVGILRIAVRLVCKEEMMPQVLESLKVLLYLKPPALLLTSRQIAYALNELLRTNAANIHEEEQWTIIFSLLERVGAGAKSPQSISACNLSPSEGKNEDVFQLSAQSDSELSIGRHIQDSGFISERGYTSDSELYENPGGFLSPRHCVAHQKRKYVSVCEAVNKDTDAEKHYEDFSIPPNQYNIILHEELSPHDSLAFLKCCESLAFLVRDAAHITAENFESCVHCLRTFVEASANGGYSSERKLLRSKLNKEKKGKNGVKRRESKRSRSQLMKTEGYDADDEQKQDEFSSAYQQASLQLLDLMHTLHTRASGIFTHVEVCEVEKVPNSSGKNLWSSCWCPLLQGIARLCCDNRLAIRTSALSLLQRALLVHDLQMLSPTQWEACFNKVLFPLLAKLLENISPDDHFGMEETRTRGANLLCKVFLQHLTPLLTLPTFMALWLTIIDFMDKYMKADFTGSLAEAIPESLKNMLLVMDTASVFQKSENGVAEDDQMLHITWDRINTFLPGLKDELFRPSINISLSHVVSTTPILDEISEGTSKVPIGEEKQNVFVSNDRCDGITNDAQEFVSSASTQVSSTIPQENSFLASPALSVILHPPTIPLVSTSMLTTTDSCCTKTSKNITDSIEVTPTTVPLLLSPSVMNESNMPMVPPYNLTQISR